MKRAALVVGRCAVAVAILLISAGPTVGVPVEALNLHLLSTKADVIVIGKLTTPVDGGAVLLDTGPTSIAGRTMTATLLVGQLLKGAADPSIRVRYVVPQERIGYGEVVLDSPQVCFLRKDGDRYEFVSPYWPCIVTGAAARIRATSPYDRVLEAIASAIESPDTRPSTKRYVIQVLAYTRASTAPVIAALRLALRNGDPFLRLPAVAGLLAAGDVSALPIAEEALQHPNEHDPMNIANLQVAIRDGVRNDAAVPTLGRLLQQAAEPETRRAVVSALGNMRSSAGLTYLGKALDDPDFEVRLEAARGLAEITGEAAWKPTRPSFEKDEGRYLRHWKAWLARRGG